MGSGRVRHYLFGILAFVAVVTGGFPSARAITCGGISGGLFCNSSATVTIIESLAPARSLGSGSDGYSVMVSGADYVQFDDSSNFSVIYE